ncbi:MAG TPA: SigE family RNA polymerase sigma factor [Nocardioides sp.]|jgi:RNA polymerase sigma-70 factor (sigma-E family)|nr:SigE family RNA polymerase sigma factor [Nocardioides sp.]
MARRDAGEFTSFVLASQASLRRTAYLVCGDWQLASDYVQDALMRVYRHWPRLRGEAEARSYARKAVVSVVIDAKRRRSSTEVPVDDVVDRVGGRDEAAASADRDLLTRCLAQVPTRQRACLVLRYYDDLSVSDVAATLGISEGTVKSQTARGLDTLQAAFARETDDDLLVSGRE